MAAHWAPLSRVRVPGHQVRHRHLRHGGGAGGGRGEEVQVSQEKNSQEAWRDSVSAHLPFLPVEVRDGDDGSDGGDDSGGGGGGVDDMDDDMGDDLDDGDDIFL